MTITIDIASDVICPWCYIGKRRFEKALATFGATDRERIKVIWRPFQLNPDMPTEGVERDEYRARKFGSLEYSRQLDAQVADAGRGVGIEFNHAAMRRTPNTFAAHRLMYLAHQLNCQDALAEALFDAYFCQGADIGDAEVLAQLAARAGIDRGRAEAFIHREEAADETRAEEAAVKALGIRGVPAFIANGKLLFTGAQSPDAIVQALQPQL